MQGERTVCCGSKYVIALYIRLSQEDRDISLRADKAESNSITNQKPNTDTLKLLSTEFDVSINTLLGSPRQLVCQCCGMPLNDDGMISKEMDGSFNEDYCKWCYTNGKFTYGSKDSFLDFLVGHMPNPDNLSESERREKYNSYLSQLRHWN